MTPQKMRIQRVEEWDFDVIPSEDPEDDDEDMEEPKKETWLFGVLQCDTGERDVRPSPYEERMRQYDEACRLEGLDKPVWPTICSNCGVYPYGPYGEEEQCNCSD